MICIQLKWSIRPILAIAMIALASCTANDTGGW
jgi:hypothetical protein